MNEARVDGTTPDVVVLQGLPVRPRSEPRRARSDPGSRGDAQSGSRGRSSVRAAARRAARRDAVREAIAADADDVRHRRARAGRRCASSRQPDVALGGRELVEDVARNLERWVSGAIVRTYAQARLARFAAAAPRLHVVNALTDEEHPCQALADMVTLQERFGDRWRAGRSPSSATATTSPPR